MSLREMWWINFGTLGIELTEKSIIFRSLDSSKEMPLDVFESYGLLWDIKLEIGVKD